VLVQRLKRTPQEGRRNVAAGGCSPNGRPREARGGRQTTQ
jgi:hypothetical protein